MKRALTILAALMLAGCAKDDGVQVELPTTPIPVPPPRTTLRGMVVNGSGECIGGASVQVVRGQAIGVVILQTTPCATWDYNDDVGFVFEDVQVGTEMTIRSSAPGYIPQEQTVYPSRSPITQVVLTLLRIP